MLPKKRIEVNGQAVEAKLSFEEVERSEVPIVSEELATMRERLDS